MLVLLKTTRSLRSDSKDIIVPSKPASLEKTVQRLPTNTAAPMLAW